MKSCNLPLILLVSLLFLLPACGSEDGDSDAGTETETYSTICPESSDEAFFYRFGDWLSTGIVKRYELRIVSGAQYEISVNAALLSDAYAAAALDEGGPSFALTGTVDNTAWSEMLTDVEAELSRLSGMCLAMKNAGDCDSGTFYDYSYNRREYRVLECPNFDSPSWASDMASAMQSIDAILRPWVIATAKAQLATLELGATCPADMSICADGSYCKDGVCTAAEAER